MVKLYTLSRSVVKAIAKNNIFERLKKYNLKFEIPIEIPIQWENLLT